MGALNSIKKAFNAKAAVEDFASEWQRPTPHRWGILGVAVAFTFAIMMVFLPETQRGAEPKPDVTYIASFAPDRTEEEVIASNEENQRRKDERAALLQRREERRRELYKELGRATGLDVDEMERRIQREEAEEAAELRRQQAERAARRPEQSAAAPAPGAAPNPANAE